MTRTHDIDEGSTGRHALTLPTGSTTTSSLTYDPSLSLVSISETLYDDLGETLGVLQFPVIAAGQYASTPLADDLRQLTRRAESMLTELSRDDPDIHRIATQLVPNETASRLLVREFGPAVRTIIQWNLERLLADGEFIDWYATKYATDNPDIEPSIVRTACNALHDQTTGPQPVPAMSGILEGLAREYSKRVANVVARLTLHPDLSISESGPIDLGNIARLNLTDRCRAFADTVDALFEATEEFTPTTLERRIADASDQDVRTLGTHTSDDYPLLGVPQRVAVDQRDSREPTDADLTGYPSGIAWLLARAFLDGGIGGAIYPQQNDGQSWLVNPWSAGTPVPDGKTYRQLWNRAVVVDHTVGYLFEQAQAGTDTPQGYTRATTIGCPLCSLSAETCGIYGCAYKDLIEAVDTHQKSLLAGIRREFKTRAGEEYNVSTG